jgi:hypothetical protein
VSSSHWSSAWSLIFTFACSSCGAPQEALDGGTVPTDAGGTADAGSADAGGADDASVPLDSGIPVDAGMDGGVSDAGSAVDAGTSPPDAGSADAGAQISAITALAVGSSCYRYQWPGRGQMPRGYIKGVALSFARSVCQPARSDIALVSMSKTTNTQRDALAWYSAEFTALNMSNAVAGLDTFRHTYTLLVGLGMRESSGEHCTGRDTSATNTTSDSAEAGAWQTSYDSHGSSPELPILFNQYRTSTRGCFLSTYAEGVTCNAANWQNWGTGADGVLFQQLEKECPGFAAEYAAVMLRVQGGSLGHYGPLRTKSAEIRAECDLMFQGVQAIVAAHPEVCSIL